MAAAGPVVLGIDIGSSTIKAMMVDEAGGQVGLSSTTTPFANTMEGVEVAADTLQAAVGRALGRMGDERRRVVAVAVAGMAESGAPLDGSGTPLAPVIAWHDPRGAETVARLDERFGDDLAHRIGQRLRTVSSVAKLGWLLDHGVEGVRHWLGVPELCLHALTGTQATEYSLAGRTGCYDVARRQYLPEVIEAVGLDPSVFPTVLAAGTVMGRVSAGGSQWSGLPEGVPVTIAGHDHLVGVQGAGAGPDDLANSVGTAETVVGRQAVLPDVALALSRRAAVGLAPGGQSWVVLASAARSGLVLGSGAAALGHSMAELDHLCQQAGRVDAALLLETLEQEGKAVVPPGTPAEIWNGLLDALAGRTWDAVDRVIELVGPRRGLVVYGRGSRSRPWMRAKAERGRLPVWRTTVEEAVARGAALHAGTAAGWWTSPDEAPRAPLEPVPRTVRAAAPMFVRSTASAPTRERDGLVSRVLLQLGDVPRAALTVTWVDVQPGGAQQQHHHEPQQVYVVVGGRGRMTVAEEERDVERGDLVFIPPDVPHSIVNAGDEVLTYVSASSPAFSITDLYDGGLLAGDG